MNVRFRKPVEENFGLLASHHDQPLTCVTSKGYRQMDLREMGIQDQLATICKNRHIEFNQKLLEQVETTAVVIPIPADDLAGRIVIKNGPQLAGKRLTFCFALGEKSDYRLIDGDGSLTGLEANTSYLAVRLQYCEGKKTHIEFPTHSNAPRAVLFQEGKYELIDKGEGVELIAIRAYVICATMHSEKALNELEEYIELNEYNINRDKPLEHYRYATIGR